MACNTLPHKTAALREARLSASIGGTADVRILERQGGEAPHRSFGDLGAPLLDFLVQAFQILIAEAFAL